MCGGPVYNSCILEAGGGGGGGGRGDEKVDACLDYSIKKPKQNKQEKKSQVFLLVCFKSTKSAVYKLKIKKAIPLPTVGRG